MPIFMVTSPDGRKFKVNGPDGSTQEDAIKYAQGLHASTPAAQPAIADSQPPSSALAFGNRGIAGNLGAAVDLMKAGLDAPALEYNKSPELPADAGMFARGARAVNQAIPSPNLLGMIGGAMRGVGIQPTSEAPFLGSKNIADMMRSVGIGVARPDEVATTLPAQVAEGVGNAAGGLLPMGGAMKGLSMMDGAVGAFGKSALESTAAHPISMVAGDLASGGYSGVGGAIAENAYPNNAPAKSIGQIVGGMASMLSPTQIAMRATGAGANAFKKTILPFTEAGATVRAADRVQGLVPDANAAAAMLDKPTIVPLRPTQQIGDERTLALENAVRNQNPAIDEKFAQQDQANTNTLHNELLKVRGDGDVADTKNLLNERQQKFSKLLDARLQSATNNTEAAVSKLAPELRGSQSSVIAREQLDSALSDARLREKELWGQVPDNILVDKTNTTKTYDDLIKNTPRAQQDDIPRALMSKVLNGPDESNIRILGADGRPLLGDKVPVTERVTELQGLRSKLLEGGRKARAEGNYNSARIHDNLADAVLNDIGAAPERIQGETGQKIRDALDFSRTLNDKFTRGEVGRILGTSRTGGEKVAPEMTLSKIMGGGKIKGDVGLQNMLDAADTPELRGAVEDHLKEQLNKVALKDGSLNSSAARKFMSDNVDILDKFPQLKQSITDASTSADSLLAKSTRTNQVQKTLVNESKNNVSKFINTPVDKEFDMIVNSRDPAGFTADLKNRAAKDPSGAAQKGLTASAADYLFSKSMKNGAIHGETLLNNLNNNPKMASSLEQIMTPDQMQRMRRIGGELKAVQSTSSRDIGGVINDLPSKLVETPIRMLAANVGSKASKVTGGGGSLVASGMFSQEAKRYLGKWNNGKTGELLTHAVDDNQLYKALLTNSSTQAGQKLASQRLEAWLLGPGATLLKEDEKKNNQ